MSTNSITNSNGNEITLAKFEKAMADIKESSNVTHAAATTITIACISDVMCSKSLKRCNMLADAASNCAALAAVCKEVVNRTAISEFRADGVNEYAYINKELALIRYGKKGFTWNGNIEEPDARRAELSKLGGRLYAEYNALRFKTEKATVTQLQPELAKSIKAALKAASQFRLENGKLNESDATLVRQIVGLAEQLKIEVPENIR